MAYKINQNVRPAYFRADYSPGLSTRLFAKQVVWIK